MKSFVYLSVFIVLIFTLSSILFNPTASFATESYLPLTQWGGSSDYSDDGQFDYPNGITLDSDGNIYVADTNNHRIQKFNSAGVFLSKFGLYGSSGGQFWHPNGIILDSDGNIYVADTSNDRIQKFNSAGVYLTQFGSHGSGQFKYPYDIAIDSSGIVYVADSGNGLIQKFSPDGTFLTQWSTGIGLTHTLLQ